MNATDIHHNPTILASLVSGAEHGANIHNVSRRAPSQVVINGEHVYLLHEGKLKARIPLYDAEFLASFDETADIGCG